MIRLAGTSEQAMARVARETSAYYLATFDPEPAERNGSSARVDVQVNRLRRKIESNPTNPLFVQTVRGIGYRLVTTT
jgi:two-component system phosphate regulon response regulator OmpR